MLIFLDIAAPKHFYITQQSFRADQQHQQKKTI